LCGHDLGENPNPVTDVSGNTRLVLGVLLVTVGLACVADAQPLGLPGPDVATEILVSPRVGGAPHVISDAASVGKVVSYLLAHNSGFRKPADTFPTPEHTVIIRDRSGDRTVVWVGSNWLGGREVEGTPGDRRLRHLDPKDRVELLALLGLSNG
jgi:hypothetical protein